MCHPARLLRLSHLFNRLPREAGPNEGSTERIRFEHGAPGHQVKNRHVGSVSVGKQYAVEPMSSHAARDIQDEMQQVFHPDIDRPRKVQMVLFESVGDRGQE